MNAFRILWSPRGAAETAAKSSMLIPLLILGAAATYADYPVLLKLRPAGLAQLKLDNTPAGLTAFGVMVFLAMRWAAPFLLPAWAWLTGRVLRFYVLWVLDQKVDKTGVARLTAWGMLPLALERLLTGTVTLLCAGNCDRFNPIATNIGFFLDPTTTSPFWYEFARGLDVFGAWAVWTAGASVAQFTEEKPSRVCPAIAALWLAGLMMRSLLLD